ncbi:alpha/beta fold hydrolase [Amycolatopsis cihanbeyliensis]|uniref:alpha/beta fold hydrolase n=1 Tax=Amycolatopsis cihanbeyliensis TaxID=1128664 RepID=UPI001B881210|nr:alpha/beta fold hydrolase [Amycolatopsis cihanbeyliensis]
MAGTAVAMGLVTAPAAEASPAEASALAQYYQQQMSWAPCEPGTPPPGIPPEEWEKLWRGMECATVTVPMDYREPDNGRLSIAVSRREATDPAKRQGVLLLNPGGPGGSGMLMPNNLAENNEVADSFDLIGFDPRGVGRSTRLQCEAGQWLERQTRPTDDRFPAIAAAALDRERACQRAGGGLRPHISTANTARDMDVIRAALGEKKINYLGFSYGTYLGAVYGSLFPGGLNRSVLDSSMHPDWLYYEQSKQQAVAARENFDAWAAWVGERNDTYHLGDSAQQVRANLETLRERLAAEPVPWPEQPDYVQIDGTLFDMMLGYETPYRAGWALFAELVIKIKNAVGGELPADAGKALATFADYAIPETHSGVFPTVTCEADWSADLNTYFDQMRVFRERYPYGPGASAAEPTECTFRSFTPPEPITDLKRDGYPVGVVVQAEFDPSTQYDGGPAMASRLENNLISVADEGAHGLYGRNDCATRKIDDYLINGVLPGSHIVCAGTSPPDVPVDGSATRSAPRPTSSLEERAADLIETSKLDRTF